MNKLQILTEKNTRIVICQMKSYFIIYGENFLTFVCNETKINWIEYWNYHSLNVILLIALELKKFTADDEVMSETVFIWADKKVTRWATALHLCIYLWLLVEIFLWRHQQRHLLGDQFNGSHSTFTRVISFFSVLCK